MAIEIKKKEGENLNSFLYRFNKKIQHSGLVKEVKRRQFKKRVVNKTKRRLAALYRLQKKEEFVANKKYGYH
ncbi:MAG: 30S ribosomal protein S21 [Patescibacteria group bacterium]|nr:30S ribosomal protein S21 [Patescibacteria group bacterium]